MNSTQIKSNLLAQCQSYVNQRQLRIQNLIQDIQESLTTETKSSAGDKHETGRAMLQLEREKAGKQLAQVQQLNDVLAKINTNKKLQKVGLGSLVYTTQATYFISISVGKLMVDDLSTFAIAANSPIGKMLIGKSVDESFNFNTNQIKITAID